MTGQHLDRAIRQALALPRSTRRPLVLVYGGRCTTTCIRTRRSPSTRSGRRSTRSTRGAYREIDLYVPEMVEGSAAMQAEGWYKTWRQAGRRETRRSLVRRSARSAIIVFGKGTRSRSP